MAAVLMALSMICHLGISAFAEESGSTTYISAEGSSETVQSSEEELQTESPSDTSTEDTKKEESSSESVSAEESTEEEKSTETESSERESSTEAETSEEVSTIDLYASQTPDLIISSADDFKAFRDEVNAGNDYAGKCVQLAANLDLEGSDENQWTPISSFAGTFDGNYHVIKGLYINASGSSMGLFGAVTSTGVVKNLTVDGEVHNTYSTGSAAGIVAELSGGILNCQNYASVSGGSGVAGIAGYTSGTIAIEGCANFGDISAVTGYAGGIIGRGFGSGTVKDCYNQGETSCGAANGGIAGIDQRKGLSFENCYNVGTVIDSKGSNNKIGALSGQGGTFTNSYYLSGTYALAVGGTSADAAETVVKTQEEMKAAEFTAALNGSGSAFEQDSTSVPLGNGYPVLIWQKTVDWTFAKTPDLIISTMDELEAFRDSVNAGDTYEEKYVQLAANLDLDGKEAKQWTPIKKFAGTFDGNGHVISGLYINGSSSAQGLFGEVTGLVENLTVKGTVTGSSAVGGLTGKLTGGTVQNCQCYVTVTGSSNVGGLVGTISVGTVICSANFGDVKGTTGYVGGIAALTSGNYTIENCYNAGTITGPASVGGISSGSRSGSPVHTNCYNRGQVVVASGGSGSLIGAISGSGKGTLTNCYYLSGTAAGGANSADAAGATAVRSAAQMTDASFLTELNGSGFMYVSDSSDTPVNEGYPVFAWQLSVDTTEPVKPGFVEASEFSAQLSGYITQLIDGVRTQNGIGADQSLLGSDAWINNGSSTGTDWTAILMGQYSYFDEEGNRTYLYDDNGGYAAFLSALESYITNTYASGNGELHWVKATEWHRASLAILAMGGDPTAFGTYNGGSIDLIADGSYNCVTSKGPGGQGINGWIWGLIAINAMDYSVPSNAKYPVDTFITEILKLQIADGVNGNTYGGWAMSGSVSDPDITAMAIQALAPYYNTDMEYTYSLNGETVTKSVHQALNEALDRLSSLQRSEGDFGSWGTVNVESTAQALVALLALNIDPATDSRFITSSGKTLLDGILKYRLSDGTFCHTAGGGFNGMATDQAGYALVAYWRYANGMRSLYDYRPAWSSDEKAAINSAVAAIDAVPAAGEAGYKAALKSALTACRAVERSESQYIYNYDELYRAIQNIGGEGELDNDQAYPVGLELTTLPNKTAYVEDDAFSTEGMVVSLKYSDGTKTEITDYTYLPNGALTPEDTEVTIYYQAYSLTVTIEVEERPFWKGSGTEEDPYLISRAQDLVALKDWVNVKSKSCAGLYFKMTDNINLENYPNWTPIGNSAKIFNGTFDGDYHVIKNLNMSGGYYYQGLFGQARNATIKNLGIASGSVSGNQWVGGIVGWGDAITIVNCWNNASVTAGEYAGGIAGTVRAGVSTISQCYNSGNITVSGNSAGDAGGFVGHLSASAVATLEDCYNTGTITGPDNAIGGIAGRVQDSNSFVNCYNAGTISVEADTSGWGHGAISGVFSSGSSMSNCYYLEAGDLQGTPDGDVNSQKMDAGSMTASDFPGMLSANFEIDSRNVNSGYPVLTWQKLVDLDTEAENVDLYIENEEGLKAFAASVNEGNDYEGKQVVLTADMNLAFEEWTPIGSASKAFNGTFDGKGHGIAGLKVTEATGSTSGFFGQIGEKAVVKNVGISSGTVTSTSVAAGLVASAVDGFQILNCWNQADVTAEVFAGGILGNVDTGNVDVNNDPVTSLISGCFNSGTVTVKSSTSGGISSEARHTKIENCYNVGEITGTSYSGGIAGWLLRQGSVENCYQAGKVKHAGVVGSVIEDDGTSIVNSYYVSDEYPVNGYDTSVGKTSEEMKNAAFAEVMGNAFKADESLNQGYPILSWENGRHAASSDTELVSAALDKYEGEKVDDGVWQIAVPDGVEPMNFGLFIQTKDPNAQVTTPVADENYRVWTFEVTSENGTKQSYMVYVTVGHKYTDELAAKAVDDLISRIPSTITLQSKTSIEAARSAYNKLTTIQKDLVEKLSTLEAAEDIYERLSGNSATVTYRTHVQTYGWQGWKTNGMESGTTGLSKRLEGIEIKVSDPYVSGGITYRTHVQTYGWQGWKSDGAQSGTTGEEKRLEAIQINLTGDMAEKYDVYYRVHAQTYGWLDWAKNGESAGTAGLAKRLESIEIKLVLKGGAAPGNTARPFVEQNDVTYRTHVQTYGWQDYMSNGVSSGTVGLAKRLEAIQISLKNPGNIGGITYRTHVQTYGWQRWVSDGAVSGTSGESKRLEAIEVKLTGQMAEKYDVYYRVHAQTYGWLGWAKNGASAGTEGLSKRLEAIQIVLVEKGQAAPGSTANAFVKK